MKVTFPHLGNSYLAIESLLKSLGYEPITPPLGSRRTLELGSEISPEEICLPFKIILGNMLEGLELGAEGIIMIGGWGPCRLGYYGEIQRILLKQAGQNPQFIMLEMPRGDLKKTLQLITKTLFQTNPLRIWRGIRLTWLKLEALERLEMWALKSRP